MLLKHVWSVLCVCGSVKPLCTDPQTYECMQSAKHRLLGAASMGAISILLHMRLLL